MPEFKLKFEGGEAAVKDGVTTLGRTSDNDVAFPSDSNVSRFHAEIESRNGDFCLIDLNSSNGTTLNGTRVSGEVYLKAGDRIVLGGSSEMVFEPAAEVQKTEPVEPASDPEINLPPIADAVRGIPSVAAAGPVSSGSRTMLMAAGGAVLIAVIVMGVAGAIYYRSATSACEAKARIISPEPGDTIMQPTEIEVETEGEGCVAKAVFTLDGVEFAGTDEAPYTATINPDEHPDLADGMDHLLAITLIDEDGNRIPQPGGVPLTIETRKVEKPEDKPIGPQEPGPQQPVPPGPKGKEVSIMDVSEMTVRVAKQFSANRRYNVSNKQFLAEVQKKAAEFAQEGYFERANKFRDQINVAFVRESNLEAPLGYYLAMSRSKFDPQKTGAEEGLWRMSGEFAKANGFEGSCGGQTIAEPSQLCAARASAVYMKAVITGLGGDVLYSVAAYGKSTADASAWYAGLSGDRVDVWNTIKTPAEREQLVRFFAAAVVMENPGKFGLKRDRPVSELFPRP